MKSRSTLAEDHSSSQPKNDVGTEYVDSDHDDLRSDQDGIDNSCDSDDSSMSSDSSMTVSSIRSDELLTQNIGPVVNTFVQNLIDKDGNVIQAMDCGGGGSCAYYSISYGKDFQRDKENPDSFDFPLHLRKLTPTALKDTALTTVRLNPAKYAPFIVLNKEQQQRLPSRRRDHHKVKLWHKENKKSTTWADHVSLAALSYTHGIDIVIRHFATKPDHQYPVEIEKGM
jgi:hypothetical protein